MDVRQKKKDFAWQNKAYKSDFATFAEKEATNFQNAAI